MKREHFLHIYNKRMLCEHYCIKFHGHIAWHSFLENNFSEFLDEVRVKINQDFVQSLMAFRYNNICYWVKLVYLMKLDDVVLKIQSLMIQDIQVMWSVLNKGEKPMLPEVLKLCLRYVFLWLIITHNLSKTCAKKYVFWLQHLLPMIKILLWSEYYQVFLGIYDYNIYVWFK